MSYQAVDPTPLTRAQLRALAAAAGREVSWGLREVTAQTREWRRLAERIPDGPLRHDALAALAGKRGHTDGAALFSVLPDRRNHDLLRALVAYETILDFLDEVSERHATEANGRELHQALIDAVEPERPLTDYYRHHPWSEDGGYLRALVECCRRHCQALPSYGRVRSLLAGETRRAQVLALNHLVEPTRRDAALRDWATREFPAERRLAWYELGAAASASLVVHALLALAARTHVDDDDIAATYAVYWPWTSLATAMLDSYVDRAEDTASGDHSYIGHYPCLERGVTRLCDCIARAAEGTRARPGGRRDAVIVASMVAMYLSKDSARAPELRASTRRLVRAGGSLSLLLLPVLRIWRVAYLQRSA
ncbi:MAG: DUF2600 family protein [Thermoleophilaceae bacterium]